MRKVLIGIAAVAVVALVAFLLWPRGGNNLRASVVASVAPADASAFARAEPGKPLAFPADHGPHDDFQTEWWYYTGNLTAEDGRRFGSTA